MSGGQDSVSYLLVSTSIHIKVSFLKCTLQIFDLIQKNAVWGFVVVVVGGVLFCFVFWLLKQQFFSSLFTYPCLIATVLM